MINEILPYILSTWNDYPRGQSQKSQLVCLLINNPIHKNCITDSSSNLKKTDLTFIRDDRALLMNSTL